MEAAVLLQSSNEGSGRTKWTPLSADAGISSHDRPAAAAGGAETAWASSGAEEAVSAVDSASADAAAARSSLGSSAALSAWGVRGTRTRLR